MAPAAGNDDFNSKLILETGFTSNYRNTQKMLSAVVAV